MMFFLIRRNIRRTGCIISWDFAECIICADNIPIQ